MVDMWSHLQLNISAKDCRKDETKRSRFVGCAPNDKIRAAADLGTSERRAAHDMALRRLPGRSISVLQSGTPGIVRHDFVEKD